MSDPWQDEGFGSENGWDEGEESLETDVEDGFEEEPPADEEDDASSDDEPGAD